MYLSTVEIKNFRSFKDIKIDLRSGLNVLVGRNNTGKTNLLKAIRHAVGPSALQGESIWLDRDDFYKSSASDTTQRTISITLTFAGLTEAQRSYFYEIVDFDHGDLSKSKAIIRFEASWPEGKRQATISRTGGPASTESPEVHTNLLASLPITFLPALRDAEASLAPGYRNRLALLLSAIAARDKGKSEEEIKKLYSDANRSLEKHNLISETKESLQKTTQSLAGSDYLRSAIAVADAEFEKILRSLQVQMTGSPIGTLSANGLGYNNLLYMAVVLEHLKSPDLDECPILLVEEPEAHLHPQLTVLLADYLSTKTPGASTPQTIVTTHSPTLAANVSPTRIAVLFTDKETGNLRCNNLMNAGMDEREQGDIQRMMDITRATLYFAKGVILVEGLSEAMLIPALAKRLGHDLAVLHISVVPICGVAFATFKKLLDANALGTPAALVTDADPPVTRGTNWEQDRPEKLGPTFKVSERTTKLFETFSGHSTVKVFRSKLTLEYDLAEAGDSNAATMATVWEECFDGTPGTFNLARVMAAGPDREAKAMAAWLGICRANHTGSKAEFAHRLSARLSERNKQNEWSLGFDVPNYLKEAVEHVVCSCQNDSSSVDRKSTDENSIA